MEHEGVDKFLGTFYNFWNTSINNIYPHKYNLGKTKHFLVDSAFHAIEHIK